MNTANVKAIEDQGGPTDFTVGQRVKTESWHFDVNEFDENGEPMPKFSEQVGPYQFGVVIKKRPATEKRQNSIKVRYEDGDEIWASYTFLQDATPDSNAVSMISSTILLASAISDHSKITEPEEPPLLGS